jgi:hypothetical protein
MAELRMKGHVSWPRTLRRLVWPLGLLVILVFRERVMALLEVPAMPPILAAGILAVGLPAARRSRRPRLSFLGVIGSALVLLCFWLTPTTNVLAWPLWVLPLVIAALVLFILPEARTFHDPEWFRIGSLMIAGSVASFWPVQVWIAGLELGYREYNVFLHGLSIFFWACMFMGGIQFVGKASDSPEANSTDPRCPGCARATVHATLRTPDAVYYCCESCDHLWVIEKPKRNTPATGEPEAGATLKARQ